MTTHTTGDNMRGQDRVRAVRLPDGRQLACRLLGDPDGRPVLGFHGTPGSSLMLDFADEAASRLGLALIAPDRPGCGGSDPKPDRRLVDWQDDTIALLDALGLKRAAALGISGGGPYALATAALLPGRVGPVLLASGMGPVAGPEATPDLPQHYRKLLAFGDRAPGLVRVMFSVDGFGWRNASKLMNKRMIAASPEADRKVLRRPELRRSIRFAIQDGFRQGGRGPAADLALLCQPWGFPLAAVKCPVVLWHGERDRLTPFPMARHVAARLPDCRPHLFSEAGHFFTFERPEALLRSLLEAGA